jgi:hypothetical protein
MLLILHFESWPAAWLDLRANTSEKVVCSRKVGLYYKQRKASTVCSFFTPSLHDLRKINVIIRR